MARVKWRPAVKCPVCNDGVACHGGGNLACVKRNPEPSVLAGILDTYGGIRFVVTQDYQLASHVRCDETLIVVPNLLVHEPIAWGDIPIVIKRIEIVVDEWIARGIPNEPHAREAVAMYQLRKKEHVQRSLNLEAIAT
jgi:hypothetical protein